MAVVSGIGRAVIFDLKKLDSSLSQAGRQPYGENEELLDGKAQGRGNLGRLGGEAGAEMAKPVRDGNGP